MNKDGNAGSSAPQNLKLPVFSTIFDRENSSFNFRKAAKKSSSSEIFSNSQITNYGKKIFEGVLFEKNSKLSLWKELKAHLYEDRIIFYNVSLENSKKK